MKYLPLVLALVFASLVMVTAPAALAAEDGLVTLQQMSPNSVLKKPDAAPQPTGKEEQPNQPQHSMAEDLKQVLQDYKISKIGRANEAVSSQYGGQSIIDNSAPSEPVVTDTEQKKSAPKDDSKKAN